MPRWLVTAQVEQSRRHIVDERRYGAEDRQEDAIDDGGTFTAVSMSRPLSRLTLVGNGESVTTSKARRPEKAGCSHIRDIRKLYAGPRVAEGSLAAAAMASSSNIALKTFSLANDIKEISAQDEIFRYDPAENRRINNEKPWVRE